MQTEIILIAILLALSSFFSGSEVALVQMGRLKVKHLVKKRVRGARILKKLKDNPSRMLITILICNNLVNVAAAAIATKLAIIIFDNNAVGISTGVMTLLLLIFGEITPKSLVMQKYEFFALFVARPIWLLSIALYPLIVLLNLFVRLSNKMFNVKRTKPIVTEEELESYVAAGREAGTIKEIEKQMIHNIFKFDEVDVSEIMTARPDMVCVSVESKLKDILGSLKKVTFSRLPVYEGSKDKIVGILNLKELYQHIRKNDLLNMQIKTLMRKPFFIPETKKIDSLLKQFQKRKEHMAIVVDEHGVVAGLVTIEDVLEEIVGEIVDETDRISPNITRLDKKSWCILGRTDIDDVNEKLRTRFEGEDFDTFGGYILKKAGKIPKERDEIELDRGYKAVIESVEENRIYSAKLMKK